MDKIEQAYKEKVKENRRLKDNFETLKAGNDILKSQVRVRSFLKKLIYLKMNNFVSHHYHF